MTSIEVKNTIADLLYRAGRKNVLFFVFFFLQMIQIKSMQQISACFIFRRLSHFPDKEFVMLKNQQLWNKGQRVLCV
jgi:hypothetical protein